jgi:hypothetical protein
MSYVPPGLTAEEQEAWAYWSTPFLYDDDDGRLLCGDNPALGRHPLLSDRWRVRRSPTCDGYLRGLPQQDVGFDLEWVTPIRLTRWYEGRSYVKQVGWYVSLAALKHVLALLNQHP